MRQLSVLLVVILAGNSMIGLAKEPTVFRVPVRVVTVPAAVVSPDGRFLRTLQADEFHLFDNDQGQTVQLDYVGEPLSVSIVVQANDSVREWLPEVRRVASTIEALIIGATGDASVSIYGDDVRQIQPLTTDTARLDKAFASIRASDASESRTLDAVVKAARQLKQTGTGRRRVILLIAQSGDTGSASNLRDVLQELELNNIALYNLVMPRIGKELTEKTISVTDAKSAFHRDDTGFVATVDLGKLIPEIYRAGKAAAHEDNVTVLTDEMGGRRIPFRKLKELEAGISSIGEELHTEYVLSYTPTRRDPGYHRIRVQVDLPDVVIRARPGYYLPQSDTPE